MTRNEAALERARTARAGIQRVIHRVRLHRLFCRAFIPLNVVLGALAWSAVDGADSDVEAIFSFASGLVAFIVAGALVRDEVRSSDLLAGARAALHDVETTIRQFTTENEEGSQ